MYAPLISALADRLSAITAACVCVCERRKRMREVRGRGMCIESAGGF